jgi:uncharacterized CHY-type Zn-finger protein
MKNAKPGAGDRVANTSCGLCSRRFGLVRYYSCGTAICSRKCLERFRTRCEHDRNWLFRATAA